MFSRQSLRKATNGVQCFSTTAQTMTKLRIGYVPEHFSTPLAFAQKHYGLDADLISCPLGTGDLSSRLKAKSEERKLDVAIGLTEGFVADLGKTKAAGYEAGYGLVGTYVQSPLCWAISTGPERQEIKSVQDLKGKKVGVSRIGSGSYVMSYVLADKQQWLESKPHKDPFEMKAIGDFAALRKSVQEKETDFFMWEHFTTKRWWDNGELKRVGEIYTPWPSWVIAVRDTADESALQDMLEKINLGVKHYKENEAEAIEYITSTMYYSKDDTREWMKTVEFPEDVRGVDPAMVRSTVNLLQKAGPLKTYKEEPEHMITSKSGGTTGSPS